MEENKNNSYKVVSYNEGNEKKEKSSIGKSVVVPFISGILGATLVVGTCVGVPSVRETLVNTFATPVQTSTTNNSNPTTSNVTYVSLQDYSETGVAVAKKVMPSIVSIKVQFSVNSIFGISSNGATASGSGIIISSDGYILTNNHIINSTSSNSYYQVSEATKVSVYLYGDETEYEAKVIGTDEQTDLAVIKIEKSNLTAAELGDSSAVEVGEFSMAIGNPLGMDNSVTSGIISAVDREVTSDGKTFKLIQTDAAINEGNSGGALVNAKGQVIGINTLKILDTGVEGMGFAIPINSTKDITDQLIKYSKVKRPFIGISGKDINESMAKQYNLVVGVYIAGIEDFSAAEKAGLKIGDVIISADGKNITTMDELNEVKNSHNIGDTITLKINRSGKEMDINVTLEEQP